MKTRHLKICLYFVFLSTFLQAQCDFDPSIEGDTLLCPESTGLLSTQTYESYQWYRRFLLDEEPELIVGATAQSLEIDAFNDPAYFFSVEVTLDNCTERSPEILVDGLAFLPPTVLHTGEFTNNDATFIICEGDTLFNTLQAPYDTLIQWFRNNEPIPEANDPILAITTNGSYTVEGAPSACPDFIQILGVNINVLVDPNCITSTDTPESDESIKFYPNPVKNRLFIENAHAQPVEEIFIWDGSGRLLYQQGLGDIRNIQIDAGTFPSGVILVGLRLESGMIYRKIHKR